jgi:dTDP-4-amino-4,6-dideoxygalactose transaminase
MANQLALKGGRALRDRPFSRWPITTAVDQQRVSSVLASGQWSFDGPVEQEFARKFAAYCGAKEALCVANGSVSLEIALRALGIGPGDEVIGPALTWVATAGAVVNVGATPVFVDVRESDWCIDAAAVAAQITARTRAIIPVHLYAQMADLDELVPLAERHGLALIEDCAHAHGFEWRGRGAGTWGQVGSYSFQQSKVMTAGEGGALVTNDSALADRIYGLKNCGRKRTPQSAFGFGTNLRLTEFQAAVLLGQLERLDEQIARKNENSRALRCEFERVPGITVPAEQPQVTRRGMYGFTLRYDPAAFAGVPQDLLIEALRAEGLPVQRPYDVVYRSPLWTAGVRAMNFGRDARATERLGLGARCPTAERISQQGLVILHHVFLGDAADVGDVAAGFAKVQAHAHELRVDGFTRRIRHAGGELIRQVTSLT